MSDVRSSTSDLPTRFAIGVLMAAVASAAVYVGGWPFRILVFAGAAVMILEWSDMHRVQRLWGWIGVVLLGLLLLGVVEYLYPAGETDIVDLPTGTFWAVTPESFADAWPGLGLAAGAALLVGLLARRAAMAWGFLYIAIPAFLLLVLSWADYGIVFWVMIVTWATDIFAYFAGRTIGGPKLAPRISPNKTWAGLIGGMAGAGVFGALAAWAFGLPTPFHLIGALMGLLAQLGDLYESWVKRRAGVKDSGTILPGHGGVLDRVDGLLPVVVATWLILVLGVWGG